MHAQKKYLGSNVPTEYDLINLLKSGKTFLMKCTHTDLNNNGKTISTVIGTQSRDNCVGSGLSNFVWPRQLDRPHQASEPFCFMTTTEVEAIEVIDGDKQNTLISLRFHIGRFCCSSLEKIKVLIINCKDGILFYDLV